MTANESSRGLVGVSPADSDTDQPDSDPGDVGFPRGARWTPVPDVFFSRDLPQLSDPVAVKLFLHTLWRIHRRPRGTLPAVERATLIDDSSLLRGLDALGTPPPEAAPVLEAAVDALRAQGLFLVWTDDDGRDWILVNAPPGRKALARLEAGEATLTPRRSAPAPDYAPADGQGRANIFELYEDNVGAVTPLLAEELKEAEALYPDRWIEEAFRLSVERNVRKWSYIRAILEGWLREGRGDEADRRSGEGSRSRFIEGRYGDYVER